MTTHDYIGDIFQQFTIISNIVSHLSWGDLYSFKQINLLCFEAAEREESRRCLGIGFGHQTLEKNKKIVINRKRYYLNDSLTQLKTNFRCKNPKLLLIMSSENEKLPFLEDIIRRQCDSSSVVCYAYFHKGNFASAYKEGGQKLRLHCSFSMRHPAFSWLCLPQEVAAQMVDEHSPIDPTTKLVIVLNVEKTKNKYPETLFDMSAPAEQPVCYGGGFVKRINVFDHDRQCFSRVEHAALAISGDNFSVHPFVINEEYYETDVIRAEFAYMRRTHDEFVKDKRVKYQCVLVLSCPSRYGEQYDSDRPVNEYELFAEYFPHIPITGIICRAQILHVNDALMRLTKVLHDDDSEDMLSVFLILTWTE